MIVIRPVDDSMANGGGDPLLPATTVYVAPAVTDGRNTWVPIVAASLTFSHTSESPVKKLDQMRIVKVLMPCPTPLIPMYMGDVSPAARTTDRRFVTVLV